MCIMEVREGQHTSTIAQAMAHNTNTVIGDMDMLEKLMAKRGEDDLLVAVKRAHDNLRRAYADLLDVFGEECASEVMDRAGHVHGNERSLVAVADKRSKLARRFMTR